MVFTAQGHVGQAPGFGITPCLHVCLIQCHAARLPPMSWLTKTGTFPHKIVRKQPASERAKLCGNMQIYFHLAGMVVQGIDNEKPDEDVFTRKVMQLRPEIMTLKVCVYKESSDDALM